MAIDAYMQFVPYQGDPLKSESQVDFKSISGDKVASAFQFKEGCLFEIEDYSFDIEQTLNIGSQSSGAGAGRVTFNPFSITRKIDKASPVLFQNACSGTPFKFVTLGMRKSSGGTQSGNFFLMFQFKLVAVKTLSWAHDDESPKETVTFEYGGLQIHYAAQDASGTMGPLVPGGWNRVTNMSDTAPTAQIGK